MPEAYLLYGLFFQGRLQRPAADAHDDVPAAPTPTPTAMSPVDSHAEDIQSDDEREFVEQMGVVLAGSSQ